MHIIRNATSTLLAAVFAISMMVVACFAASPFEGAWKVMDTAGKPFEITLSADSKASASRGEGMVGTWKWVYFNNDNEAHAPENAKTMQRLLARWKIAERVRSTRRKEPGLHAATAFRSRAVRN